MRRRALARAAAVTATALAFLLAPATAAATPRTWDLTTYTPPDGFTVDESARDHVVLQRVVAGGYCLIGIYSGTAAQADLDASFAAEWSNVVASQIGPVAVPATTRAVVGGASAAIGGALGKIHEQPVFALLTTIDAGAKVVSILAFTPSPEAFKAFTPSIQALLNSVSVRRVAPDAPPPVETQPAETPPAAGGAADIPPPPRPLTVADLAGEWAHSASSITSYASVATGTYAGYSAIQFNESWTITAKGAISTSFHGISTGIRGTGPVHEKRSGTITLGPDGDLWVRYRDTGSGPHYLVRGWLVGPSATILKINGPWWEGGIPADIRADPHKGYNLDEIWIRKVKPARAR